MNNIEIKIDELFDELEKTKLYNDYVKVKESLENNTEIMSLINKIKRYQKVTVNNDDKLVNEQIKELYKKLNSYPIYQSYLIIKEELEEELLMIKSVFESTFNNMLSLS